MVNYQCFKCKYVPKLNGFNNREYLVFIYSQLLTYMESKKMVSITKRAWFRQWMDQLYQLGARGTNGSNISYLLPLCLTTTCYCYNNIILLAIMADEVTLLMHTQNIAFPYLEPELIIGCSGKVNILCLNLGCILLVFLSWRSQYSCGKVKEVVEVFCSCSPLHHVGLCQVVHRGL